MNESLTITATVGVWCFSGPERVYRQAKSADNGIALVSNLAFYGTPETAKFGEFVRVGEADVTIRLRPANQLTGAEIQALNAKLEAARTAYLQMQAEIHERISKLQALEMTVEAA